MKKAIAIILILSISLMFLYGCGSGADESGSDEETQDTASPEREDSQDSGNTDNLQPPALPEG